MWVSRFITFHGEAVSYELVWIYASLACSLYMGRGYMGLSCKSCFICGPVVLFAGHVEAVFDVAY